jgi:hypothetical protein
MADYIDIFHAHLPSWLRSLRFPIMIGVGWGVVEICIYVVH